MDVVVFVVSRKSGVVNRQSAIVNRKTANGNRENPIPVTHNCFPLYKHTTGATVAMPAVPASIQIALQVLTYTFAFINAINFITFSTSR
jgi:hypothetical protein